MSENRNTLQRRHDRIVTRKTSETLHPIQMHQKLTSAFEVGEDQCLTFKVFSKFLLLGGQNLSAKSHRWRFVM